MRRYFVTGGTGVVGTALIPVLLEDPGDEIVLLVRASDEQDLSRRTGELFAFWQLGEQEAAARQRIMALRGDATAPRFGLDEQTYQTLIASVTNIVHAAGAVRMNLPLEAARRSAVGSAQHIIDLAWNAHRAGRLNKVEFVSTVGVGGHLRTVVEDWIETPRLFHNTYEQSKAEAEVLVREHRRRGLPITVHRPSMVVGDSRTGRVIHFQVFYHLCEFLSGRRTYGLFPPLDHGTLDIVTSDAVARTIAWSSRSPDLSVPVLHAASGPGGALPLADLRDEVRRRLAARGERLHRVFTLPHRAIGAAVTLGGWLVPDERARRVLRTLPTFLDYLRSEQRFEVARTRSLIKDALPLEGLWDWRAYLPRVLDCYFDHRTLRV